MNKRRRSISNTVFAIVTSVLVIVAAVGFYLYAGLSLTPPSNKVIRTSYPISGGFFSGSLVEFYYTQNYTCEPPISSFGFNSTEVSLSSKFTVCEVGAGNSSALAHAEPVFVLVPAFAGLSIFGVKQLGASSQGYPTFNGTIIFTQCGAGGSPTACPDHPTYLYSPAFTAVEQHIGIYNGVFGLPEGVLPTPAHDHVVDYEGPTIPWYVIAVLVFDPNIYPDGATGQCRQIVPSNLSDPTGNCLTSFAALAAALTTKTTANTNANSIQPDPIYSTLGNPATQVVIPGVSIVSENSPANSNLFIWFGVNSSQPYV